MDNVLRVKDGVLFTKIAPSGFRLLEALSVTVRKVGFDLTITSACDGEHSGLTDPHHRGEAYDVRSHDLTLQQKFAVTSSLGDLLPLDQFYYFLEDPGTENEHFHLQVKKGTTYP